MSVVVWIWSFNTLWWQTASRSPHCIQIKPCKLKATKGLQKARVYKGFTNKPCKLQAESNKTHTQPRPYLCTTTAVYKHAIMTLPVSALKHIVYNVPTLRTLHHPKWALFAESNETHNTQPRPVSALKNVCLLCPPAHTAPPKLSSVSWSDETHNTQPRPVSARKKIKLKHTTHNHGLPVPAFEGRACATCSSAHEEGDDN
jgi:hypothetical protein